MPIQTIFSSTQLAAMRQKVENESPVKLIYSHGDHYPVPPDSRQLNTLIEVSVDPPELFVRDTRAKDDAENAIKVYEYLGTLNRTQAADPRLWTTLTHTTFWSYCQNRWAAANQNSAYILEHWFERRGGGLGALRRNAISRLWWAAHLTVAPWDTDLGLLHLKSSDRYKYTRILLSQAQIFQDVIEREFGSNLRLRTILLNALHKYMPDVSNRDQLSKTTSTQLLLTLKNLHLEALPAPDAGREIDSLVAASAKRQAAA